MLVAKLLEAVQEMAEKLARLHKMSFTGTEKTPSSRYWRQADEIKHLKENQEKLRYWQVEHILDLDIFPDDHPPDSCATWRNAVLVMTAASMLER